MERIAIGFMCGMVVLGVLAFLVVLKARDMDGRILKAVFAVVAFLASVATIVGIAAQLMEWDGPERGDAATETVRDMSVPDGDPAAPAEPDPPDEPKRGDVIELPTDSPPTPIPPTPIPPTSVPPPLLPQTFAELVYYSTLSSAESDPNWPHLKDDNGHAGYDGQGYTLHAEQYPAGWQVLREMELDGDFALQIDVTPLSSGVATAYAISFHWTRDNSGYTFLVAGDGRCALVAVAYGASTVIEQERDCPGLSQATPNRLLLIVEESHFMAAIDDHIVLRQDLPQRYGGTRLGLTVYPTKKYQPAEARFNNLSIWQP